jgi:hypothetical protein
VRVTCIIFYKINYHKKILSIKQHLTTMKYLQKVSVRIIVSLLAGGFITEIINISSGDPNHLHPPDKSTGYTMVLGIVIYVILTALIKKNDSGVFKR